MLTVKQLAKRNNDELIESIVNEVEKNKTKINLTLINMAQIPLDKLESILDRSSELENL